MQEKHFLQPTTYDLKSFFEADWTLPAGARPTGKIISENSKWRSETMDWKGCHLLNLYTRLIFGDSRHFLS